MVGLRSLFLPEDMPFLEDIAEENSHRYNRETYDETCCIQDNQSPFFVVVFWILRR